MAGSQPRFAFRTFPPPYRRQRWAVVLGLVAPWLGNVLYLLRLPAPGIDLTPRSSFRDFQAQVGIWNRKWSGERAIYDRQGALLDRKQLSDSAAVDAILCWSAIPGGSRHHWGSDVDVIDAAAVPPGYTVELLPAEYAADGIFGRLSQWLDANMRRFGFYRPYRTDRGRDDRCR